MYKPINDLHLPEVHFNDMEIDPFSFSREGWLDLGKEIKISRRQHSFATVHDMVYALGYGLPQAEHVTEVVTALENGKLICDPGLMLLPGMTSPRQVMPYLFQIAKLLRWADGDYVRLLEEPGLFRRRREENAKCQPIVWTDEDPKNDDASVFEHIPDPEQVAAELSALEAEREAAARTETVERLKDLAANFFDALTNLEKLHDASGAARNTVIDNRRAVSLAFAAAIEAVAAPNGCDTPDPRLYVGSTPWINAATLS